MEQHVDPHLTATAATAESRPAVASVQVGDAWSLGLAAFATTTFVFGLGFTTIWGSHPATASVLSLALIYGGAIQVLGGIWAFARRQGFPAVALCSFGAFYVSYYVFQHSVVPSLTPGDASVATEIYLLAWLILSTYIFLGALQVSGAAAVTYFFWWLTYLLLVIGTFLGNSDVTIGGGAAGVATAAAAWYGSCALLVNDLSGKSLLPLLAMRQR